jgi:hypothetical protein
MNSWSVQDAKARFSELLETCLNEGLNSSPAVAPMPPCWCRSAIGKNYSASRNQR